jgi:hypothetical protein
MRKIKLLAILALVTSGCDNSVDPEEICNSQMKLIRNERGTPDEVRTEENAGDFFETWIFFPGNGGVGATYLFRWGPSFGTTCFVEGNATGFIDAPPGWQLASAIDSGADAIRGLIDRLQQG